MPRAVRAHVGLRVRPPELLRVLELQSLHLLPKLLNLEVLLLNGRLGLFEAVEVLAKEFSELLLLLVFLALLLLLVLLGAPHRERPGRRRDAGGRVYVAYCCTRLMTDRRAREAS